MANTPKLWVMKSLTPKLEKTDLRTMLSPDTFSSENSWSHYRDGGPLGYKFDSVGHAQSTVIESAMNLNGGGDIVVHARQVAVFDEGSTSEDWQPSPPSSPGSTSSADSRAGFYSFVDDLGSPQAKNNEAYMVSPERLAKMSTLKEKSKFKLQTYTEERKPEKLFQETNGDSHYQVHDTLAEDNDEEEPDRLEIIRSQAPKKNFKEQWSALENLDLSKSPQRLIDGFSLCYSTVSTKQSLSEADQGAIDNQQIDFNAVRKQFLLMERSKQNSISHSSQPQVHSPKPQARVFTKEENKNLKDYFNQNQIPWKRQVNEASTAMTIDEEPKDKIQSHLNYKLDVQNGSQAADNTGDFSLSTEPSITELSGSASVTSMSETPIEREIRIAQEREEDLRRSRGIFHPVASEMVEIKTKPILSQPLPQIKPIKSKESNRMSLFIQREMGRVNWSPGLYDKGNSLGEKMKSSESLSDQMNRPSLSTSSSITPTGRSVTVDETLVKEPPVSEVQRSGPEKSLSPCCPHRHQDESAIYKKSNFAAEKQNNSVKIPNQLPWIHKAKESAKTFTSVHFSPEPVRSSYKLESSNETAVMLSAPDVIRREIEEDLRREQELQELRETSRPSLATDRDMNTSGFTRPFFSTLRGLSRETNSGHSSLHSSSENLLEDTMLAEKSTPKTVSSQSHPWNVDTTPVTRASVPGPTPRLPSVSILTAQPWIGSKPISPAVLRTIPNLPSTLVTETSSPSSKGLTEKLLEDFEERRMKMKLEEGSYAGIQLIDDINNEVVEVTRVTRHKNPRALRWEAGVYANEDSS